VGARVITYFADDVDRVATIVEMRKISGLTLGIRLIKGVNCRSINLVINPCIWLLH
jgi:hypothetical protein